MAQSEIVDIVKRLIISYAGHDLAMFRRGVESIIRLLTTENRPSEAKSLRDALYSLTTASPAPVAPSYLSSLKGSEGLISFAHDGHRERLFFSIETQSSLEQILTEHRSHNLLRENGFTPKTRLLFWGPPGCGKTATAKWLASELGLPCGIVRLGTLITSFVGETGANIQKLFNLAERTPMVLLLDEADAIAKSRDDTNDVGELRRIVNSLLQGLDSAIPNQSLIILATNHSHLFDSAIWRRFDEVIEFKMPSQTERLSQLKYLTNGLSIEGSLLTASKQMSGFSYSDIHRAVACVAKQKIMGLSSTIKASSIVTEGRRWIQKTRAAAKRQ